MAETANLANGSLNLLKQAKMSKRSAAHQHTHGHHQLAKNAAAASLPSSSTPAQPTAVISPTAPADAPSPSNPLDQYIIAAGTVVLQGPSGLTEAPITVGIVSQSQLFDASASVPTSRRVSGSSEQAGQSKVASNLPAIFAIFMACSVVVVCAILGIVFCVYKRKTGSKKLSAKNLGNLKQNTKRGDGDTFRWSVSSAHETISDRFGEKSSISPSSAQSVGTGAKPLDPSLQHVKGSIVRSWVKKTFETDKLASPSPALICVSSPRTHESWSAITENGTYAEHGVIEEYSDSPRLDKTHRFNGRQTRMFEDSDTPYGTPALPSDPSFSGHNFKPWNQFSVAMHHHQGNYNKPEPYSAIEPYPISSANEFHTTRATNETLMYNNSSHLNINGTTSPFSPDLGNPNFPVILPQKLTPFAQDQHEFTFVNTTTIPNASESFAVVRSHVSAPDAEQGTSENHKDSSRLGQYDHQRDNQDHESQHREKLYQESEPNSQTQSLPHSQLYPQQPQPQLHQQKPYPPSHGTAQTINLTHAGPYKLDALKPLTLPLPGRNRSDSDASTTASETVSRGLIWKDLPEGPLRDGIPLHLGSFDDIAAISVSTSEASLFSRGGTIQEARRQRLQSYVSAKGTSGYVGAHDSQPSSKLNPSGNPLAVSDAHATDTDESTASHSAATFKPSPSKEGKTVRKIKSKRSSTTLIPAKSRDSPFRPTVKMAAMRKRSATDPNCHTPVPLHRSVLEKQSQMKKVTERIKYDVASVKFASSVSSLRPESSPYTADFLSRTSVYSVNSYASSSGKGVRRSGSPTPSSVISPSISTCKTSEPSLNMTPSQAKDAVDALFSSDRASRYAKKYLQQGQITPTKSSSHGQRNYHSSTRQMGEPKLSSLVRPREDETDVIPFPLLYSNSTEPVGLGLITTTPEPVDLVEDDDDTESESDEPVSPTVAVSTRLTSSSIRVTHSNTKIESLTTPIRRIQPRLKKRSPAKVDSLYTSPTLSVVRLY